MNTKYNPNLTGNSQNLRRSMTKEERHLWYDFLKHLPLTVNRQKVIGSYIVDFYCSSANTVIEIDGTQHFETEGQENDRERDNYLKSLEITVLRFSNLDVNKNFESVCEQIYSCLLKPSP